MRKFNIGELVRFKQGTLGCIFYMDQTFEVVGHPVDSTNSEVEGQVILQLASDLPNVMNRTTALNSELDLILPDIFNTGISSGIGQDF